ACEDAVNWLAGKNLAHVSFKKKDKEEQTASRKDYAGAREDAGAKRLSGAIFEGNLDLTHPLAYGYRRAKLPVFRTSNKFMEPAKGAYAMPFAYTGHPLMAGYMHHDFGSMAPNSASIIVSGEGKGRIICMVDNVDFRAFWYGTNKLMANAIFFGNTISGKTVEGARK
ncbi:MAG: zinc carboxypeptidase, partial [Saprospiraceae bacterium]